MATMDITRINRAHAGQLAADCPPRQLRRAARYVASKALDAGDCAMLLDMLGLDPRDGLATDGESVTVFSS
ncbi:MAG: hypothetical protein JOZ47_23090 [Kutzneria sp.]|nr:hypothetical protein [Kutzneria sp.]MBV9847927.1 hypothetical protein [Kutzneria sp.]